MKNSLTLSVTAATVVMATVMLWIMNKKSHSRRRLRFESEAAKLTREDVLEMRQRLFCSAQSVSYANSGGLMMMNGEGQYLFDSEGVAYLDTRNNVPHVGHSNPKVVNAVCRQLADLNTNTRYLHPNIALLAQKLVSTFPPEMNVCFFVNSGSEANDLALRLARAHTGNMDTIVVERAYHGHTVAVIDISPYKYGKPGGVGKRDWVHEVPCPDTYRGLYRANDPSAAEKYAAHVGDVCKSASNGICCFITESLMSVAGVVLPPTGYLQQCYAHVRAAGGVCIADEVQVGFGRTGHQFWGFQQQGVIPDIVTMGKPFGNGMPLAAVVTTRAIADSFAGVGIEYFNTFGGNPVCCAAGLAVLEIIETENLQEHARVVGDYLMSKLKKLAQVHEIIGDIRGSGLFIGIELVRSRETLAPATAETSYVCTRMKNDHHVLMSIDGEHDNCLVIKPPMCFNRADSDQLIDALDIVFSSLQNVSFNLNSDHTPT